VQDVEHQGARQQQPAGYRARLQRVGQRAHGRQSSEILCDRLELAALLARQRADRLLEAVLDVVADQRFLGLRIGLLDRVQLLGAVESRPLRLDHADDAAQVSFAPQALDDLGMALVDRMPAHYPIAENGGQVTVMARCRARM